MAGIIDFASDTGLTIYSHIRSRTGTVWNGSAFEAYSSGNYGNYDVALTEDGTSGYYKATFPAGITDAARYTILHYLQSGGSPAEGDQVIGSGSIIWDGSSELNQLTTEIADQVWDEARSGHTTQGTYGESFGTLVSGAAIAGTLSTTAMTTDLTESTDDHYNGRIIIWVSGVLTAQASDITDYDGTTKKLTYTAVTEAPSATDKFIIV